MTSGARKPMTDSSTSPAKMLPKRRKLSEMTLASFADRLEDADVEAERPLPQVDEAAEIGARAERLDSKDLRRDDGHQR